MTTKLLRSATLSLGVAAGALLAVLFLPRGVAAAGPEDDLYWVPDPGKFTIDSTSTDWLGDQSVTGTGPLDAFTSPYDVSSPVLTDGLQANVYVTEYPLLGDQSATLDISVGDASIPAGSDIYVSEFLGIATQTVVIPDAGLFGLPEIAETLFTPLGDFSF
jgi:hypothetical protein